MTMKKTSPMILKFALILGVSLAGFENQASAEAKPAEASESYRQRTWTSAALQEFLAMGIQQQVQKALGAPDSVASNGDWIYRGMRVSDAGSEPALVVLTLSWSQRDGQNVVSSISMTKSE